MDPTPMFPRVISSKNHDIKTSTQVPISDGIAPSIEGSIAPRVEGSIGTSRATPYLKN